MKSRIPTSMAREPLAYTRAKTPWLLDTCEDDEPKKGKFGKKLFHYISGGGMRSFGRTVREEEANRQRTRFLIGSSVLAIIWLIFYCL